MPVITVVTNVQGAQQNKQELISGLTAAFAAEIKCPPEHVHVWVMDGQCFSFGGDADTPAAFVTVKASALQIWPEVRKTLVEHLAPLLHQTLGIAPERSTTMFEELPVENIAVGSSIAVFMKSPRSSMSPHDAKPPTFAFSDKLHVAA